MELFGEDYLHHFKKIPKTTAVMFICSDNDEIVPKEDV